MRDTVGERTGGVRGVEQHLRSLKHQAGAVAFPQAAGVTTELEFGECPDRGCASQGCPSRAAVGGPDREEGSQVGGGGDDPGGWLGGNYPCQHPQDGHVHSGAHCSGARELRGSEAWV